MIPNYSTRRPQSFIYQNKEVVEDTITDNDNAFIFGPAIYNADMENDASNINVISSSIFNPESTQILLAGTPVDSNDPYIPITNAQGAIVGFKQESNTTQYYDYVIPNSQAWLNASQTTTDASDATVSLWAIVSATVDFTFNVNGTQSKNSTAAPVISANGVTTVTTPSSFIPDNFNSFYCEYSMSRQFVDNEDLVQIASPSDIRNNFGPIVSSNPLAFACSLALTAAGKTIFAQATGGKTASGYQSVLGKIEKVDSVQFICPIFDGDSALSNSVMPYVLAHVQAMSNATKKRWRRAYFGSLFTSSAGQAQTTVRDNVVSQAVQASSDRFILVWTDNAKYLTDNGLATLSNDYVAAIVAGLRSANVPQQGLSKMSVPGIAAIPNMYSVWNDQLLDSIAEQGVFIITQDYKNADVYIRHQLDTDTNQGLLYWEDSIGVNVDEISYMARDLVEPYVGKRNATPQTLDEINNKWYAALLERTNASLENPQIGPQIVQIVDGSVKTFVDKNLKDRIIMTATLVLPLPINTIVVYINAVASL